MSHLTIGKIVSADPIDVSIIIVTRDRRDLLGKCLNDLLEITSRFSLEVIVVDNASTDGTSEMVGSEFPEVTLINNIENLGFSRANNIAMKGARGRYFLLLNDDAVVTAGALEKLVSFADSHPRAAVVGPRVLNGDGTLQSKGFAFPSGFHAFLLLSRIPWGLSEKT